MTKAEIKNIIENHSQLLETIRNGCASLNKRFKDSSIEEAKVLREKCIALRQGLSPIDFRLSNEVSNTVSTLEQST